MIVAAADTPMSWTLFSIVMPPAIVSPSWAASSAAWIVAKQPGVAPTHRLAADAERAAELVPRLTAAASTAAKAIRLAGIARLLLMGDLPPLMTRRRYG